MTSMPPRRARVVRCPVRTTEAAVEAQCGLSLHHRSPHTFRVLTTEADVVRALQQTIIDTILQRARSPVVAEVAAAVERAWFPTMARLAILDGEDYLRACETPRP